MINLFTSPLQWLTTSNADTWNKIIQSIAIVIGGVAAYFKFFKGRTYAVRLEVTADVRMNKIDYRTSSILITCDIKNIGTASVKIDSAISSITLYKSNLPDIHNDTVEADWEQLGVFEIFEEDHVTESGVLLAAEKLLYTSGERAQYYRIESVIFANNEVWIRNSVVSSEHIINQKTNRKEQVNYG